MNLHHREPVVFQPFSNRRLSFKGLRTRRTDDHT
nr:MAG TPA: hypothetical protein [Caudoviricetes sp.]